MLEIPLCKFIGILIIAILWGIIAGAYLMRSLLNTVHLRDLVRIRNQLNSARPRDSISSMRCGICGKSVSKPLPKFPKLYDIPEDEKTRLLTRWIHEECCIRTNQNK